MGIPRFNDTVQFATVWAMEGIQFDEGEFENRSLRAEKPSFFIGLVLKTGLVATPQAANMVLIGITIASVIVMAAVFFSHIGSPHMPTIPPDVLEGMPGE